MKNQMPNDASQIRKKWMIMEKVNKAYSNFDEYIALFPDDTKVKLVQMRELIRSLVPEASEKISYQMPTFYLNGNLVHFAGYKHHIGFYPGASGIAAFENELAGYKHAKGSVQFPLDRELPTELITKIVEFRREESINKKKK